MKIEVAVDDQDSQKKKGDLLEKIAKDLLETQNYQVETEIRRTGVELDLLCKNKANSAKKYMLSAKHTIRIIKYKLMLLLSSLVYVLFMGMKRLG